MERELDRRQMSVSALAREALVQRGDIYRWWRGEQRPTRNSLARVAAALGVPPSMLSGVYGQAARAVTPDPLIETLTAQTNAISALVEVLRSLADRAALDDPRVADLERVVDGLVGRAMSGEPTPRVPPETTKSGR